MTARRVTALLLLGMSVWAHGADFIQTFNDAKTWGSQQQTTIPGKVNTGTAQSNVPNYQTNSSATSNYGNGNTPLFGLGSAKVSNCSANPTDPQYTSQECNAVNTIAKSPMQRPKFTITKNDPILQAGSSIINNPSALAGSINGTYSACTTKTTTTPATNDTETCDIYHPVNQQTCSKILTVSVINVTTNCSSGDQMSSVTLCPYGCTTVTTYCAGTPGYVTLNFTYSARSTCSQTQTIPADGSSHPFSCSAGGMMSPSNSFHVNCSGSSCSVYSSNNTFFGSYTPYTTQQSTTDSWNDQCTTFEAAAQ